ncbi:3'-5' exonuclease [Linum grandiflorum]
MVVNYVRPVYFDPYEIETTVTNQGDAVDNWVRSFPTCWRRIVGLDCEWKPLANRYEYNKTSVLQLCVGIKCLIIQIFYLDYIPQSLVDFLQNPNNHFVGVGVDADVAKLTQDYGLRCSSTADIQTIAWQQLSWNHRPGLKDILFRVERMVMEKPPYVTRSNWQKRYLDDEQVEYACIDAFASYKIGYSMRQCIDSSIC